MKILIHKKRILSNTRHITASINSPNQGIFWVIDDELIALYDPVDIDNFIEFDYFPRGRVIVNPEFDDNGDFTHYECYVYGDKCILYDKDVQSLIEDEFRLYLSSCKVHYEDEMSLDDTHYTCHNCK